MRSFTALDLPEIGRHGELSAACFATRRQLNIVHDQVSARARDENRNIGVLPAPTARTSSSVILGKKLRSLTHADPEHDIGPTLIPGVDLCLCGLVDAIAGSAIRLTASDGNNPSVRNASSSPPTPPQLHRQAMVCTHLEPRILRETARDGTRARPKSVHDKCSSAHPSPARPPQIAYAGLQCLRIPASSSSRYTWARTKCRACGATFCRRICSGSRSRRSATALALTVICCNVARVRHQHGVVATFQRLPIS